MCSSEDVSQLENNVISKLSCLMDYEKLQSQGDAISSNLQVISEGKILFLAVS